MRKRQKGIRTNTLMTGFIVLIMITSVLGYMWGSSRTKLNYNGYNFYQQENNQFMLRVNDKKIIFNYYPSELEWINATAGISELFSTPMVYITYEPNSTYAEAFAEAQFNLARILDEVKSVYAQNAFTSETDYDIPVIACSNATALIPVIRFEKTNKTGILKEGACVRVGGEKRQEILMAHERLAYIILGVMD